MCNQCGKYEPSPGNVHIVESPSWLVNFYKEKAIEEVVREQGHLVIASLNSDYDEKGNFIGDYSKEFEMAKKYEKNIFQKDLFKRIKWKE